MVLLHMISIGTQPVLAAEKSGTISVVSFDGLGYMDAQRYMERGSMPNLNAFQKEALYATDFITVMPSLTAPSHAAMATGASPAQTGIVSNEFHTLGNKVKDDQSGFSQTIGVTPIWKEVQDHGKVTATVSFPGSNPDNSSAATYAVYSGGTLAESNLHNLKFSTVEDERADQLSLGSVKVEEAVIPLDIKDAPSQQIVVLRTDEKVPRFYISMDRKVVGTEVKADSWIPIVLDLQSFDSAGFYVKLKGDVSDKESLQLFQGTIMGGLYKGPADFSKQITSKFGFYPAADEVEAFKAGEISREEYEETGERFADWVTDVSLYIKNTYQPDLLFYYYPHVDTELHNFLLRDPAQPGYTLAAEQKNERYVSWAVGQVDRAIGRIKKNLNEKDHLLLISDHGLEPVHTRISPNKELEKAGLLVKNDKGHIDSSKTKAYAKVSGTIAHVYVNLKGRETKGIVEPAEFEQVKQEIVSVFTNRKVFTSLYQNPEKTADPILKWLSSKDDNSNKIYPYPKARLFFYDNSSETTPYEKVWTGDEDEYASLNNDNSGDVFLSAAPGYLMGKDSNTVAEPVQELGSHGGDPNRPSLHPILYAAGPGISTGELRKRITMTDIAPSLYELLRLPLPDFIDGQPIWKTE